jgi:16S rRNA (cytidine1402-2'-O)-methyltransferase
VSPFAVVGTPIGNLEDITQRAVRTLTEAEVIFCEDTRRTRKLLSALHIPAPRLVRLDRHNEKDAAARVVSCLERGERVALVTDAGMPAISDPGADVVAAVAAAGYRPEVVPGPDAVSTALAASGLPASPFLFAGFLPRKGRERAAVLAGLARTASTVVIYEAPTRVRATVGDLKAACGPERPFVAARELTKLHEEVWRGTLAGAAEWLATVEEPRGEWVLVLGPWAPEAAPVEEGAVSAALQAKLAAGVDRRRAVAEVAAELGVPRRQAYDAAVALKSGT